MELMAYERSLDAAQQGSVTGGCVLIMHSLIQWQCPFPSPDFHHIRNTHHQQNPFRILATRDSLFEHPACAIPGCATDARFILQEKSPHGSGLH